MNYRILSSLTIIILLSSNFTALAQESGSGILEKPSESTVFFTDPTEAKKITESSDSLYLSQVETIFSQNQANEMIESIKNGTEKLYAKIQELDEKYGDSDKQYLETRAEVINIINDIQATKEVLSTSIKKIYFYQRNVVSSVNLVKEVREAMTSTKYNIEKFSQFMYKLQNEYYKEDGTVDELKLFIKSNSDISNELSNTSLIEALMNKMNNLVATLNTQEKKAIENIKVSNKNNSEIRDLISDYQQRLQGLQEQQTFLSDYLTLYDNSKLKMKKELSYLFSTQSDVYTDITTTVQKIYDLDFKEASFDVTKKLAELDQTLAFAKRDENAAPLSWPLYPIVTISRQFNDKTYESKYKIPFLGIEIPAEQNTPLYAVDEGLVYKIANKDNVGLNWVLLLHKNGVQTIYLYPNQVIVQEGEIVRRGQIIGYSGGEPGTKGAGFVSGGPNLTFMVIDNGQFMNPIDYLDMSVVQDQSSIPTNYKFKYLKDKYSLPRDLYAVKPVQGDTIEERRQNFLNLYGVGVYKQPIFWEDSAQGTNIDVDVGICIAFAESTLGRHLTTSNNIGNVGNNDRGDRVGYDNPMAGARLIYTTLNNQYLGHYHILLDYNGYGNPEGKNYATSKYNWQNNVTKCLTMIKGYYIPDEYPVRIGPNPNR